MGFRGSGPMPSRLGLIFALVIAILPCSADISWIRQAGHSRNVISSQDPGRQRFPLYVLCARIPSLRGGWDGNDGDWDRPLHPTPQHPPSSFRPGPPPPHIQQHTQPPPMSQRQQPPPYPPQGQYPPFPPPSASMGMHPSRSFAQLEPQSDLRQQDRGMRYPPPDRGFGPPPQHAAAQRFNSVLVKNLHASVHEQEVIDLFDEVSAVKSVKILNAVPAYPTRAAYVNFLNEGGPDAAMSLEGRVPPWNEGLAIRISRQPRPYGAPEPARGAPGIGGMQQPQPRPNAPPVMDGPPKPIGDWMPIMSRSLQKYYWMNKVTNETTWDTPTLPSVGKALLGHKTKPQKDEESDESDEKDDEEDMYDSDGYIDDADRARLSKLSYSERKLVLTERLKERDRRKGDRKKADKSKVGQKTPAKRGRAAPAGRRSAATTRQKEVSGAALVGRRIKLQIGGRRGLIVQHKTDEVDDDKHLHRIVWDDGRRDEWLCLEDELHEIMDMPTETSPPKPQASKGRPRKAATKERERASARTAKRGRMLGQDSDDDSDVYGAEADKDYQQHLRRLDDSSEFSSGPSQRRAHKIAADHGTHRSKRRKEAQEDQKDNDNTDDGFQSISDMSEAERRKIPEGPPTREDFPPRLWDWHDMFKEYMAPGGEKSKVIAHGIEQEIRKKLDETAGKGLPLPDFEVDFVEEKNLERRTEKSLLVDSDALGKEVERERAAAKDAYKAGVQDEDTLMARFFSSKAIKLASKEERKQMQERAFEFLKAEGLALLHEVRNASNSTFVLEAEKRRALFDRIFANRYHKRDDPAERCRLDEMRYQRLPTEDYIGPSALRTRYNRSSTEWFFTHLQLANVKTPTGEAYFLPGRDKVVKVVGELMKARRERAQGDILTSHKKWLGAPQRHEGDDAESKFDLGAGIEYIAQIGAFLLSGTPSCSIMACALGLQIREGGLTKPDSNKAWYADAPFPETTSVLQITWNGDRGVGSMYTHDLGGMCALLNGAAQDMRKMWVNKSVTLTYPRDIHPVFDDVLLNVAKIRKQWLQPCGLFLCQRNASAVTAATTYNDKSTVDLGHTNGTPEKHIKSGGGSFAVLRVKDPQRFVVRAMRDEDAVLAATQWSYVPILIVQRIRDLIESRSSVAIEDETGQMVAWALEDMDGGLGMLFVIPVMRGMGLGRWAAALLTDKLWDDVDSGRRVVAPYVLIADADRRSRLMLQWLGYTRTADMYTMQVGWRPYVPRHPEDMPEISVTHWTCQDVLPDGPARSIYCLYMDSPTRMPPKDRVHYILDGRSTKSHLAEQLELQVKHGEGKEEAETEIARLLGEDATPEAINKTLEKTIAAFRWEDGNDDPVGFKMQKARLLDQTDGKFVHLPYNKKKMGQYLDPDWIEDWMALGRRFRDEVPTIRATREDEGDAGYMF